MDSEILGALLRANVAGSLAIAAVLAVRGAAARRLGADVAYRLWALVPCAVGASLLPAREVTVTAAMSAVGQVPAASQAAFIARAAMTAAPFDLAGLLVQAWLAGVILWLAVVSWRQYRFGRALGPLTPEAGVFRARADGIGPAVVGALRPRIVIPADFEARFAPEERDVVLAHEQGHVRARDPLVNALAALAQALAWFNPLIHLAAARLRVDQELACDAAVVARHPTRRRVYAEAMLKAQFAGPSAPLACYWPGRGHPLKARIALLNTPAPSRRRRALGMAAVTLAAVGAGAVAWAGQPPQVRVVRDKRAVAQTRPAEGWQGERRAEVRRAVLARKRAEAMPAKPASHLDRQLIEAVLAGEDTAAGALIAAGADVDAALIGDGSPLIVAAREGRLQLAERLVRSGADVNRFVMFDETPLINAARAGHIEMVRFLLDHGADPNLAVPSGNLPGEMRSPLGMAHDRLIADYLRSRGARS
jgi:beta-lactamase regulating signal transducer with metallopeptidase domain